MSTDRAKRLQLVLQLAEQQEQQLAGELRRQRERIGSERQQLQQLCDYACDYRQQLNCPQQAVRVEELINKRNFLQRLSDIQKEQQQRIEQLVILADQLQQQWQQCYHRRKSIAELIERLKLEHNALLEKKLQQQVDELSTLKSHRSDA